MKYTLRFVLARGFHFQNKQKIEILRRHCRLKHRIRQVWLNLISYFELMTWSTFEATLEYSETLQEAVNPAENIY